MSSNFIRGNNNKKHDKMKKDSDRDTERELKNLHRK